MTYHNRRKKEKEQSGKKKEKRWEKRTAVLTFRALEKKSDLTFGTEKVRRRGNEGGKDVLGKDRGPGPNEKRKRKFKILKRTPRRRRIWR